MKYQVFENDKPADSKGFPCLVIIPGRHCSKFRTFEEALVYLRVWVGLIYEGAIPALLEVGQKIDYNGYGDVVEIRVVPD